MTVRVERTFEVDAPPDRVWAFIADPGNRAEAISVVAEWERNGEETVWHLELPIPFLNRTVPVRTRETAYVENERVAFVGRSAVMRVRGEHRLAATDGGTRLVNEFVVDGRLPGVERFFERNFDDELENLRRALDRHLEAG